MFEEETSINVEKTQIRSLLEEFKLAVNRPRLYVIKYFEDLKNQIDIEFCKTLNEINNELVEQQVKEEIYEKQSYLIEKVNEFESLCLKQINEDSEIEFQVIIEKIENNLNGQDISQDELRKIYDLLSNEVEKIQIILFQNKSMFFLNANEIKEDFEKHQHSIFGFSHYGLESLSKKVKQENLPGMLITIEECIIQKESIE